jgi:cubilin
LNDTSGNFNSPGYPSYYPNNANVSWLIQVPHGYSIKLVFDDSFAIECQYDYLAVYDGLSTGNPVLEKYCGADKPPDLYSFGTELLVVFITDIEHQSSGFYANYTALRTGKN